LDGSSLGSVATGSALDGAATFTTTTVNTWHPFD
jgi:hypothetical protein